MADKPLGPFQLAANKLKEFAIEGRVPNADEIELNGLLGDDWDHALESIVKNDSLRMRFDYGVLREVRDDPALKMSWFRFVGDMGQSWPGPFEFLKIIAARAREEADGTPPVSTRTLFNRVCGWPEHW